MQNFGFLPSLTLVGISRVIAFGFGLIFTFIVLFVLNPLEYGNFLILISLIQILSTSFLSWPNQYLLKYGRQNYSKNKNINNILGARILTHLILISVLVVIIYFFSSHLSQLLKIDSDTLRYFLIFGIIIFPLIDLLTVICQIFRKFLTYSISPIIQRSFQILALGLIYFGFYENWKILLVFTIISYLIVIISFFIELSNQQFTPQFKKEEYIKLIKYSSFIPISTISMLLFNWIDIWMIRFILGGEESGIYAWSYSLILIFNSFFTSFAIVVAPKLIDLNQNKNFQNINFYFYRLLSICIYFSFLLPLIIIIFNYSLDIILPNEYRRCLPLLIILVNCIGFQFLVALIEPLIYAKKKLVPKLAKIFFKMLMIKIIFILIFINFDSIITIALATFFSYIYCVIKMIKLLNFKVFQFKNLSLSHVISIYFFSLISSYFIINQNLNFYFFLMLIYFTMLYLLSKFYKLNLSKVNFHNIKFINKN